MSFFWEKCCRMSFDSDPESSNESELIVAGETVFLTFKLRKAVLGWGTEFPAKFREMTGSCLSSERGDFGWMSKILNVFFYFQGLEVSFWIKFFTLLVVAKQIGIPTNQSVEISNGFADGANEIKSSNFLLENDLSDQVWMRQKKRANLSKEAFCRFFETRTGKTFYAILGAAPIAEAKLLLKDLGIAEIALE